MKEIYDWVPWFRELAEKIAEEGEAYLTEKAEQVEWEGDLSLFQDDDKDIDPFSFFYFLASKNTSNQLKPVYDSVSQVFEIKSPLPDMGIYDYYIFPSPDARYNNFYNKNNKKNFEFALLWRLFSGAVKNDPEIEPDDFENALKINGVGVARLTQTLFLINPEYFLPLDNRTYYSAEALGLPRLPEKEKEIKKAGGYEVYRSVLKKLREVFPECQPYEINMFLYLQESGEIINADSKFFQISTYVLDDGDDYWEDFKDNYWVYTGAWYYPLAEPKRGDIILVRTGYKRGRAIGIVLKNDYKSEYKEDHKIHVLWINKSEKGIVGTDGQGFNQAPATNQTYKNFEKSYKPSFDLINSLTGNSPENDSGPELNNQQTKVEAMKYPLNQILYGPPGTGKTWNTVNYAVAIIESKSLDEIEDDKDARQRFRELKRDGQIAMVTFHQNFTYEDFIEGIRPVLADDGNGNIEYELSRGVFREIVERADKNRTQSKQIGDKSWNMDELLQAFAESIQEKLESGETINLSRPDSTSGATIEKIKWSGEGKFNSFQLGGSVTSLGLSRKLIERDYENFYKGNITSKKDIKPTRESTGSHHGLGKYYLPLFENIKQFHDGEWQPEESDPVKKQNYVLIIDEINRGNIARIFGELITLIEPSKRIGGDDAATVTLPYSQEEFGLPDNLYIIGTMNTSDRSIALLDTALRRRFEFIEMMPDSKYVSDNIDGVDCQKLLDAMNDRIRFLLDREHQIGHTYFMEVKRITGKDSLEATFKNKIIPLLQEYFYDNWEKIDLVLNKNGFIQKIDIPEDLRGSLVDDNREVYELLSFDREEWKKPESYQNIYRKEQGETE